MPGNPGTQTHIVVRHSSRSPLTLLIRKAVRPISLATQLQIADKISDVKVVRADDGLFDIIELPEPKSIYTVVKFPDPVEERVPEAPMLTPEQQSLYWSDSAVPDILQYLISAEQEARDLATGLITRSMSKSLSTPPLVLTIEEIDVHSVEPNMESNLLELDNSSGSNLPEPDAEKEEIINSIFQTGSKYVARNWEELCQHVQTDEDAVLQLERHLTAMSHQ